jgi:hypothetical protein
MKLTWMTGITLCSVFLLMALKSHELKQWQRFYKNDPPIKFAHFSSAREKLKGQDLELLKLWESMLTGRTAPLGKELKEQYRSLGLAHIFTPSGFHLSALLVPMMKLIHHSKLRLLILLVVCLGIFQLQGQAALKRMGLIKIAQHLFTKRAGFIVALLLDVMFGSFQKNPLSFTYSFLFLGIIYSAGRRTFIYFFLAQGLLAYFQAGPISPFLIILSPILNLSFALVLPILFLCSFPLVNWQLQIGLWFLNYLQQLVDTSAMLCTLIPFWYVNFGMILLGFSFVLAKKRWIPFLLLFLSNDLNMDHQKTPVVGTYEFVPTGNLVKRFVNKRGEVLYFADGKCQVMLVRGLWWEKCSPKKKRSTRKKFKKPLVH